MSEALTGGCACGRVRYILKPGFRMKPYACHCSDCQRRTGSAFTFNMVVAKADFDSEGELNSGQITQPSGAVTTVYGCTQCMSRIYGENDQRPGLLILRAGTLDNASEMEPGAHFWTKSKQAWVSLPDNVPLLQEQPTSQEEWLQLLGPQ